MYVPTKYSHDVAISFYPRFCPKNCERKNWGFLLREQVKVANVVHELKGAPFFSIENSSNLVLTYTSVIIIVL